MRIFYGGAIQGNQVRSASAERHRSVIGLLKEMGHEVCTEHTTGKTPEESAALLDKAIGPLPPLGIERTIYVRNKMIEFIEGDIGLLFLRYLSPASGPESR